MSHEAPSVGIPPADQLKYFFEKVFPEKTVEIPAALPAIFLDCIKYYDQKNQQNAQAAFGKLQQFIDHYNLEEGQFGFVLIQRFQQFVFQGQDRLNTVQNWLQTQIEQGRSAIEAALPVGINEETEFLYVKKEDLLNLTLHHFRAELASGMGEIHRQYGHKLAAQQKLITALQEQIGALQQQINTMLANQILPPVPLEPVQSSPALTPVPTSQPFAPVVEDLTQKSISPNHTQNMVYVARGDRSNPIDPDKVEPTRKVRRDDVRPDQNKAD